MEPVLGHTGNLLAGSQHRSPVYALLDEMMNVLRGRLQPREAKCAH